MLILLLEHLDLHLLRAISLVILENFKNTSSVSLILFESAFVMMMATWTTCSIIASALAAPVMNKCSFTMPHVIEPFSNVPLFVILVELITISMTLISLPVSNVELVIIKEALTFFTIALIFFPITSILITRRFLPVNTDITSFAVSVIWGVDLAFVSITVCVGKLYGLTLCFTFAQLGLISNCWWRLWLIMFLFHAISWRASIISISK